MSARPAPRPATYEDVLAAPPHLVAEVLSGVLHTNPRPAAKHTRAASSLGMSVGSPFDHGVGGPGGWVILYEPELHLGPDIAVPDLAGWRRENFVDPGDGAFYSVRPDWCCEVLSKSTMRIDRGDKADIYAREGVSHLWFVDPVEKTLEIFRLEGGGWLRLGLWYDDAIVRPPPFEAVELPLVRLWDP